MSTAPGATELTRMPCGPFSIAAVLVRPTTPCFAATYAGVVGCGRKPDTEEMLMIEPPSPWAIIWRSSYFCVSAVTLKSTAMSRSQ